ncbi:hypothetical protein ES705_31595 [subsurface metagenome]|nr:hypothetical protein [Methanosarcinales archaeon]
MSEEPKEVIKSVWEELRKTITVETAIGKPIEIEDKTLIPIFGVGFGAGGGGGKGKEKGCIELMDYARGGVQGHTRTRGDEGALAETVWRNREDCRRSLADGDGENQRDERGERGKKSRRKNIIFVERLYGELLEKLSP